MTSKHVHFITGGTGFLGRYLVKSLLRDGLFVWVLARPSSNAPDIFSDVISNYDNKFRIIYGDVTKKDFGMSDSDVASFKNIHVSVWHLAANLSFLPQEKENVFFTNVDGVKNVVDFSNKTGSVFYYVSTAYVCGDAKEEILEDELRVSISLRNNYEASKYAAEKLVRGQCETPYVIFRPSIIVGDAYQGKAKGCTFGYYRFAFMFYVFKNWLKRILSNEHSFWRILLRIIGTKYDKRKDELTVPWLIAPYPKNGKVNIVPVDYVVASMIKISQQDDVKRKTFHLVHPNPPVYIFMFQALAENLGYKRVKYIGVPNGLFFVIFKIAYFLVIPWRKYFRSANWYMPYILKDYNFSMNNMKKFGVGMPAVIDKDFLDKLHTHAKEEVFDTIKV